MVDDLETRVSRIEDELGLDDEDEPVQRIRFLDEVETYIEMPITADREIGLYDGFPTVFLTHNDVGYAQPWELPDEYQDKYNYAWHFETIEIVDE